MERHCYIAAYSWAWCVVKLNEDWKSKLGVSSTYFRSAKYIYVFYSFSRQEIKKQNCVKLCIKMLKQCVHSSVSKMPACGIRPDQHADPVQGHHFPCARPPPDGQHAVQGEHARGWHVPAARPRERDAVWGVCIKSEGHWIHVGPTRYLTSFTQILDIHCFFKEFVCI